MPWRLLDLVRKHTEWVELETRVDICSISGVLKLRDIILVTAQVTDLGDMT